MFPEFQSHAGSIEARQDPQGDGSAHHSGFNPTLVRLRQSGWIAGMPSLCSFQSHAGSIEARLRLRDPGGGGQVSIPRWFD